jgi:hypothetical protein
MYVSEEASQWTAANARTFPLSLLSIRNGVCSYYTLPTMANEQLLSTDVLTIFCQVPLFRFHFFRFPYKSFSYWATSSGLCSTPDLEEQVSVIINPHWQGGPVLPPRIQLLFVAFHDKQGYSGGILTLPLNRKSLLTSSFLLRTRCFQPLTGGPR